MKVLILAADGFIGRNVYAEFKKDSNVEVVSASRSGKSDYIVDLQDPVSIKHVLGAERPDVIVTCAGVAVNNKSAYRNGEFCRNLLEGIVANGRPYPKVVTSGSAAEYGVVKDSGRPVSEDMDLLATSDYGKSKIDEEEVAHTYAGKYGIDVTVARIFNPIGPGMGEKFILTSLIKQIEKIKAGEANSIVVSRLDSMRDYVDVRDVARAMRAIAISSNSHYDVYNIGSGYPTSNKQLIEQVLSSIELDRSPIIIESLGEPEPTYASWADTTRLKSEFSWSPKHSLGSTVEDIMHAQSN